MNADEYKAGDITVPESIPTQVVDLAEYRHILTSIVPEATIARSSSTYGVRLRVGVEIVYNFSHMPSEKAAVEEMKSLAEQLRLAGIRAMGLTPIIAAYEAEVRVSNAAVKVLKYQLQERDTRVGQLQDELGSLKERLIEMGGGEV